MRFDLRQVKNLESGLEFEPTTEASQESVNKKAISGFPALRQTWAPMDGFEPTAKGSLQSQGGFAIHYASEG
ncbi:hypothetical protein PoB_004335000 [Plakobranchus ocellatus]|uniref:Uncharacterized protein n=1 Tax=Plakobranchus ocellatus TaxID=259542 RepID=A0AAV4BCN0_9GAST|nr:hypothetical protein PoB_004335000 [Plakobranchus ocellatus]